MNRFFTFGCSFTQYWRWPTWADAVGRQKDFFENWGLCGAGNSYILWSLMECNQSRRLNPDDEVWIMWTNTSREDRYVNGRWLEGGNVYWSAGSSLPDEYVKKFADERGYLIRDMANIASAKNLLDHWGCRYRFLSMVPLSKTNKQTGWGFNPVDKTDQVQDVLDLYQDVLDIIEPSVQETIFGGDWWTSRPGIPDDFDPKTRDIHPTPSEHVEYLDCVAPGTVTQSTRDWMLDCTQQSLNKKLVWKQPNRPRRL